MKQIQLKIGQDHVESLAKLRNPLIAVEELIWNGLDADAKRIEVSVSRNELGGLKELRIKDDGFGIPAQRCEEAFGSLGQSPKLQLHATPAGRVPHGKSGKGRFRAFGIGHSVTWVSRFLQDGTIKQFSITGLRSSLCQFEATDAKKAKGPGTGVEAIISDIDQAFPSLTNSDNAVLELSRRLAPYLKKYPGIVLLYDDQRVDPTILELASTSYQLTLTDVDGRDVPAELTVIEWKVPMERALYLCDESGFALDERYPAIQAPGFNFPAYLRSPLVQKLADENAFAIDALHPVVAGLLDKAKDALRTHFRSREASRTKDLVRQWQEQKVYPFDAPARDPVSQAEQEVFDVCAIKVYEYLPGFEKAEIKSKRLTFRLIREALENNPDSLQMILRQVLDLPSEQQDDLAAILGRTKLAAIINAARTVMNRLDFLGGLDAILFGDLKEALLERQHLHRILVQELWIFGEQYLLGVDDESLRSLLEKHVQLLERDMLAADEDAVTDLEGKARIIDLMLYRRYPQLTPDKFEHLVIELKRPSCKLGQKEIGQIENYAFSVAADERFDKANTRWTFLLIGNELTAFAENRCRVQGKEFGHIHASDDGSLNIYLRKWSTVLDQAKWRYEFFRGKLEVQVTTADGLQYLRARHKKHLPTDDANSDAAPAK